LSKLNFQYVGGLVQNDSLSNLETNTLFKGKEFIVTGKLGENNDDSGDDQVSVIIDAGGKYHREFDICLRSESNLDIDEQAKLSLSNSTAVDEKEMLTPVSTLCFRPRAYPKSEAQNFLKNLHAFLNIKQLQQSIQVASNESAKEELRKKALDLSLKNNFVTDLTSLVVTKPDEEPVINKLVTDLFTEDDLIPVSFSASSSLTSSRNKINRPSPSVRLGLIGNGVQFDPRYASVSYSSRPRPRPGVTTTTKYYLTTTTTTSTSTTTQQPSTDLFDLIATDYNNDTDLLEEQEDVDGEKEEKEEDITENENNSTSIGCSLKLFSKTYYRGDSLEITEDKEDLEDFDDKAVTATLEGTCCWDIFEEKDFGGAFKTLNPSFDYIGANSFGSELFRKVSSVAINIFCS